MFGEKKTPKKVKRILTPQESHSSQHPRNSNIFQTDQDFESIDPKQIPLKLNVKSRGQIDEEPQQIQLDFKDSSKLQRVE